jgi:hypothetical protein
MIGQNAPVAEPVPSGFKQDHLHRPACNEILRPIIAGIDTPFFLTNLLNVTVRVDQFAGLDADFLLLLSKAPLHQLAHRVGQYFDANAEGPNFWHRFKHPQLNPGPIQAKRRRRPAYTTARDQDMYGYEPESFIRLAMICSIISLEPPPMAPTFMSR